MSAIAAFLSKDKPLPSDAIVGRVLDAMRQRGTDVREVYRDSNAVLAIGCYEWQVTSSPLIVEDGELVAVADAAIYYQDDLRTRLARSGVQAGPTAGHLLTAGYRAYQDRLADVLEGDYAFIVWDRRARRLVAGRDFVGTRPLYHSTVGEVSVLASTVGGVRAFPGCSSELNLAALAERSIHRLGSSSEETVFLGIHALPAGHALTIDRPGAEATLRRAWSAPNFLSDSEADLPFHEAALHLRGLLEKATAERLPRSTTAVTLSGGWDSPSVYAMAHVVARGRGMSADSVQPVSLSYPEGDLGREDELISDIAGWYSQEPHWLDVQEIPLLGPVIHRARVRDEPFVHPYEGQHRALARGARAAGASVCFDGLGGDHLFQAQPAYLSDLLRRGRVGEMWREWKVEELGGAEAVKEWLARPLLGLSSVRALSRARNKTIYGYLESAMAPWIRDDFAARHGLIERERRYVPQRLPNEGAEQFERRWILGHPFYHRHVAEFAATFLRYGVETRSPLIDGRVVAFAATRPRRERRSGRETKRLLRAALTDLLPPHVLAPRRFRTGTTIQYFASAMCEDFARLSVSLLADPLLAQMGIVDRDRLHTAIARVERGHIGPYGGALVSTLNAEIWLRRHLGDRSVSEPEVRTSQLSPLPRKSLAVAAL